MDGPVAKAILDSIQDLRADVRNVDNRIREMASEVGGKDGIRERLMALEVKMEQWSDREVTPISITPAKRSAKDHIPAAGVAGAIVALAEIASALIRK